MPGPNFFFVALIVEAQEAVAAIETGANVAGGRGFYLKGDGVCLNQALINFSLDFVEKRGYTALQTPFFMRKDIMAKCAQLAQFDEELYKITCAMFFRSLVYLASMLPFAVQTSFFCAWYASQKHWLANNILGLAFCIQGIEMLSRGSFKTGAILLISLERFGLVKTLIEHKFVLHQRVYFVFDRPWSCWVYKTCAQKLFEDLSKRHVNSYSAVKMMWTFLNKLKIAAKLLRLMLL